MNTIAVRKSRIRKAEFIAAMKQTQENKEMQETDITEEDPSS